MAFVVRFEVVIGLRTVHTKITRVTKVGRIRLKRLGHRVPAPHIVRSHATSVPAKDQGVSRDRTYGGVRIRVLKANAIFGQPVNVRCRGLGVSITTHPMMAVVFAGDPKNIWPLRRLSTRCGAWA